MTSMGIVPNPGRGRRPLLQKEIEAAIANTTSNAEAARYLNVNFDTYKKYAKLYGLYEQHKNLGGKGRNRPKMKGTYGLESILNNEHPNYDRRVLRERLISAGYLKQQCGLCGFNRMREVDGRCPLILHHIDGDTANYNLDNLQLRCYNCTYLTSGKINVKPIVKAGVLDDDILASGELTLDDIRQLQAEVRQELSHDDDE